MAAMRSYMPATTPPQLRNPSAAARLLYAIYSACGIIFFPLLMLWLFWRLLRGKETSLSQKLAIASMPRPQGKLLWLHAASVGELRSIIPLLTQLEKECSQYHFLITTGTVTSAAIARALPIARLIHQFVPVDISFIIARFLRHWKPDMALWVESELWPVMLHQSRQNIRWMGLINARMSARSHRSWSKWWLRPMIQSMLQCFDFITAQSVHDQARLTQLGAREVKNPGNLKLDATALPADETQLQALRHIIGERPVWVAASTHAGEEIGIAKTDQILRKNNPQLLTILAPRHAIRGDDITTRLRANHPVAQRSQQELPSAETQIYVADTMGELGLWYRLAKVAFLGGSWISHGGQNPIEALVLGCTVASGAHVYNFEEIYAQLRPLGAAYYAENEDALAAFVQSQWDNPTQHAAAIAAAQQWIATQSGALEWTKKEIMHAMLQAEIS